MSHIVTIKTQVRDPAALQSACGRLQLQPATFGSAELFATNAIGWLVTLPEWRYPVAFDTEHGEVQFDNFNGAWGNRDQLDRLIQAYAVEKAKLEARKKGYTANETLLENGSIRLQICVSG